MESHGSSVECYMYEWCFRSIRWLSYPYVPPAEKERMKPRRIGKGKKGDGDGAIGWSSGFRKNFLFQVRVCCDVACLHLFCFARFFTVFMF